MRQIEYRCKKCNKVLIKGEIKTKFDDFVLVNATPRKICKVDKFNIINQEITYEYEDYSNFIVEFDMSVTCRSCGAKNPKIISRDSTRTIY